GQSDLVTEQVAGGRDALADQQTGGGQAVEELLLADRASHRAPYGLAQFFPCRAVLALAFGFVAFGAGGSLGGGAVTRSHAAQAVVGFDAARRVLGAAGLVVQAGPPAVVTDQGGDDVDVAVGVPDGRPPARGFVAVGGDAGGGEHAAGNGRPVLVGQDRILRAGPHGQVPHVLLRAPAGGQGVDGLVEQPLKLPEGGLRVAARVGRERVEGGHQVRVGVLLMGAWAVQVADQPDRLAAALVDSGDHAGAPPSRWASRASAASSIRRAALRTARVAASRWGASAPELRALAT